MDANPVARAGIGGSGNVGLNDVSTRTWDDTNKNFVPDCDFANFKANGECGNVANQNYGTKVFTQSFDPEVTEGWGNRQYEWNLGVSVQQELFPRVSATIGYYRTFFDPKKFGTPEAAAEQSSVWGRPLPQKTLYLHGNQDGLFPLTDEQLHNEVRPLVAADATAIMVSGVGHFMLVEKPHVVNRYILDFIRS